MPSYDDTITLEVFYGLRNNEGMANESGLCDSCRWVRTIRSDRGAVFYQCGKSFEDPSFPKYPRLPVMQCRGYEPVVGQIVQPAGW